MTPCCFTTYCSACIRQYLLADGAFTCPSCAGTDIALDSLRPNRAFEKLVAAYNERAAAAAAEASPAPVMPPSTSSSPSPSAPLHSVLRLPALHVCARVRLLMLLLLLFRLRLPRLRLRLLPQQPRPPHPPLLLPVPLLPLLLLLLLLQPLRPPLLRCSRAWM